MTGISQRPSVKVQFKAIDEAQNLLRGMEIRLYKENVLVDEVCDAPTKVKLALDDSAFYTIEIALETFITKRIVIDTEHLDEIKRKNQLKFEVELHREEDYKHLEAYQEVFDYPAVMIEYDTLSNDFIYNEEYRINTRNAIERMLIQSKRGDVAF